MSKPKQRGALAVSIDVRPTEPGLSLDAHRQLRESIELVLDMFQRRKIAATWALADTDTRELVEPIRSAGHEVALLLGEETKRRSTLADAMIPRVLRAQAEDSPLRTLVCEAVPLEHAALLAKYGITAVAPRGGDVAPRQARGLLGRFRSIAAQPGPTPIRYGLWQLPATVPLARHGAGRMRRALDDAAAAATLMHAAVGLEALQKGRRASALAQLLDHADRLRTAGRLRTETLAQTAARLTGPETAARPARSILRPVA